MNRRKEVIAITHPYSNGQKFDCIAIEYENLVVHESLTKNSFSVEGRTVVKAYTNDRPQKDSQGKAGNYVILEMDPNEEGAKTVFIDMKKARKPRPGEPFAPGMFLPPAEAVTVQARVHGFGDTFQTTRIRHLVVENFISSRHGRLSYNLFTPMSVQGQTYPLVVFIPDAGVNGDDPLIALLQGAGAVSFAEPAFQKEHPCYVLAIQVPNGIPFTTDDFTVSPEFKEIMEIVEKVVANNPIDPNRLYLTGQSQGAMADLELNARYPDRFAASLIVAGQWDAKLVGKLCSKKHFFVIVSEGDGKAYPIMASMIEEMEANGGKAYCFTLDARAEVSEQEAVVAKAMEEEANVLFLAFKKDSVLPEGEAGNSGGNHVNTWPAAYRLKSPKEWLFQQSL